MRILLVEDDSQLGDALRSGLRLCGFTVDWVRDGFAAWHELSKFETSEARAYDACVLDIALPRLSGLEVLSRLRTKNDNPKAPLTTLPVLMLTARDDDHDIAAALDAGADDYVVKPVHIQVLAARLRALVRRQAGQVQSALEVGSLRLDPASRQVWLADAALDIQGKEFDILYALILTKGRILTRENLAQRLYEWGQEVQSNAIEVHIHHLRKKLGAAKNCIATVRGIGYQFNASSL